MNKASIRTQETLRRRALSQAEVLGLTEKLLEQFTRLDFSEVKVLHIFLPIAEKNEPDTFMLIRWLKTNHPAIKILVPRADFNTSLMTHHPYRGEEDLQKNLFNILEPMEEEQHDGKIDMVIVPLLAFDILGYRVGYGKGFYDRFLAGLDTLKVGLSLFEHVDTIADTHVNDVKLDLCLTPTQMMRF
ncbi:5-formyltetrahydrofolate cyclo-ligase [Pedobacter sp. AW31-3R]|uniref:5-formyltetrahydrofolate cyclo-ligase n=1 Tax=Pedobacter sp. AW31-3R TaxID=3445781 RepID=UPI003FA000AB